MGSFDFAACEQGNKTDLMKEKPSSGIKTDLRTEEKEVAQNRKIDLTEHFYLQLYPTGKLLPFSVGFYTTEALRTIRSITIWPFEEKSLQILWEQSYSQLFFIL